MDQALQGRQAVLYYNVGPTKTPGLEKRETGGTRGYRISIFWRIYRAFDILMKCTGWVNFSVSRKTSVPVSTNPSLR